ncbi:hypothetical protein TWF506_000264 [Arthrobotrys conoides]|uniref:Uncharacterized protein n=1 Tax=Arthrobotrys conoides TaxID=74498 RepID=A0AAN8NL48_9PEZI
MPAVIYWGRWVESTQLVGNGMRGIDRHIEAILSLQPSRLYTIDAGTGDIIPDKLEILKLAETPMFHAPPGIKVTQNDPTFPQVAVPQAEITRTVFKKLVIALKAEKDANVVIVRRESDRQGTCFLPLLARAPGAVGISTSHMIKSQRVKRAIKCIAKVDACIKCLTKAMAETIVMSIRQASANTSEMQFGAILSQVEKTLGMMDEECGTDVCIELGNIFPPNGLFIPGVKIRAGSEEE